MAPTLIPRLTSRLTARDVRLANFHHYEILVNVFVVVLLISNLVGSKIVDFGSISLFGHTLPIRISGAQMLFPITYIFGDIFTEVYGYSGSRRAIWIGFFASGLMAAMSAFVVWAPPAPEWHNQQAFEIVLGVVPRFVIASLIAFWAGEFTNSYIMAKMKLLTQGKYLWSRTIGSTVAGQLVDSTIIICIAFGGRESIGTIVSLIVSGYTAKVIYETVATPLTYAVVNFLKRSEGADVYDAGTNFSPFASEKSTT
jgi:queuosine precursor transporter